MSFSKYSMYEDFAKYLKIVEAIVVAYNTNKVYDYNQLKLMLVGDAKYLLETQLPNETN